MSDTTQAVTSPSAPEIAEGNTAPVTAPPAAEAAPSSPAITRDSTVALITAALASIDSQPNSAQYAPAAASAAPSGSPAFDATAFDAAPLPEPDQPRGKDGKFVSPDGDETPEQREARYKALREEYGDENLVKMARQVDKQADALKAINARTAPAKAEQPPLAKYIGATFADRFPDLVAPERLARTTALVDQTGTALFQAERAANPNATKEQLKVMEAQAIETAVLHVARKFNAPERKALSPAAAKAAAAQGQRTIPPNGASQGRPLSNLSPARTARQEGVAAIYAALNER